MLKLNVIGAGAAGNKAAINLMEKGFNPNYVTLINSTIKDIPADFKNNAIIFGQKSDSLGGCGKERHIGKQLILKDLKTGSIDLSNIVDPDVNAVVIVSSTEGGSGSAITPIIAKYIKEVMEIPVIVCLFFGFNSDVRGMQNSIEICQELSDNYGVIGISNYKFLESCNNNKIKSETSANDLFVKFIEVLIGKDIIEGSQNIDDTDLFKLVTTPGYMNIGFADISKVKNDEQYNKVISDAIDDSKLIDISSKGAKRIGVIFDVPKSVIESVNLSTDIISDEFGIPYEMFTHIQSNNFNGVTWIATGMPMPINEIKAVYEEYKRASDSVNKTKDNFFSEIAELKGNQEDSMFNMLNIKNSDNKKTKDSFFEDFGLEVKSNKKPVVKTTTTKNEY